MVKGKKVETVSGNYEEESRHNEKMLMDLLRVARPDIWVMADVVDSLRFDPYILLKVMRQAHNIAIGSGYGQVLLAIEKGVARYVRGEDVDKLELPIIKK